MDKLLRILQSTMETPKAFGTLHIVSLAVVAVLTIVLCVFFRNADRKTYRRILLILWAVMITMEAIKQLNECYYVDDDGSIVWRYYWASFPFQLCSLPLFVLPLIAVMKEGKVRDALSAFSYTFLLLGGVTVMAVPSTVFYIYSFLNVQTMVHHGLQIVSCIYIAVHERKRIRLRAFGGAVIVFLIAVAMATAFNVGLHALYPEPKINMFYISPYFKRTMPIFDEQWSRLHWAPMILLYSAGLSAISFVIFMLFYVLTLPSRKSRRAKRA